MSRIIHPRPQAGTQKFIGILFRDGFAEVKNLHPEVETSLLQHGFTVESDEDAGRPFFDLTVAELRDLAEAEGIVLPKSAKKAEIVSAFVIALSDQD